MSAVVNSVPRKEITPIPGAKNPSARPITKPVTICTGRLKPLYSFTILLMLVLLVLFFPKNALALRCRHNRSGQQMSHDYE